MKFYLNPLTKAVRNGLGAAMVISLAASPSAVLAQDAAEADAEETAYLEEVIVTGSRLTGNPNLASATPVLSVSGVEAENRGNVRIEDFVNVLPQVFAGQASEVSNGASGTATLNLRGLGSVRTLVMIDGRRLPYGSSGISSANVDIIPMQLVERVDILTGGASAVYGSDAIGGVANFILKRDFEGVEAGYQWGTSYSDNDDDFWASVLNAADIQEPSSVTSGDETVVYGMIGLNSSDGRGNATLYASYEDRESITQDQRVFSGCALGQDSGSQSFGGFGCIGSANFRLFGGPGGFAFQEESGNIIPWAGGPSQTYNFGPRNFFQRPSERYNLYGKAYYEIMDGHEVFADVSYINNTSDAQIAETASFGIGAYSINCANPYIQNTPGLALTDIFGCDADAIANNTIVSGITASHRNVEGGPRNSRLENSAWRIVTGLRGSFADDIWGYEVFAQVSQTRDQSESTNDFVVANLQQSLLAVDDGNGNVVCMNPSGGCVPYNPFQRINGGTAIDSAQTSFIQGVGLVNGSTEQTVYGANVQADLGEYGIQIPSADYGMRVLFGYEYRKDELSSRPDEISQVPGGGFTGVGGATLPVEGQVDVDELYAEFELPIISDMTGIQELTLRGSYRYSDYNREGNGTSTSVSTDSYGVSLAWSPVEDVRFRTQFQRSVRAPNVIELFTGQNTGLPNLSPAGVNANGVQLFDPCASNAPLLDLATCARTGVTAAQYGTILDVISGQTQSLTGGNPFLQPEEADTVTFGVVWQPSNISGLSVSLDYFDITVDDTISAGIPAQTTLDNCLASGDPVFCNLIVRSGQGSLAAGTFGVGFQQTNINIAALETNGIDAQVVYDWNSGDHGFRVDYAATWLDTLDTIPFPGADPIVCSGFFGNACGTPNPEYRHRTVFTWMTPWDVDVNTTWRYFGETDNDNTADTLETTMDAVNYIDVNAIWTVNDTVQLNFSVLNLFQEDPPVFSGAGPALGNGNTYPTVFDIGIQMFAGIKLNF